MQADLRKLQERLDQIERLTAGSKLGRFLFNPVKYISAIGYWRLVYPLRKKGRFARVPTFFGTDMQVALPAATEIFLFGAKTHDSEIRLTRFLIKNLQPGDIFADVGAHFGFFSLLAAHLIGETGRVFSFEAARSNFEILKKNTASNPTIFPYHRAVSDNNATLVFHEFPVLFSEYNSLLFPDSAGAGWIRRNPPKQTEVKGIRLDDFFEEKKLVPAMVKIDVEGGELQAIKGMEGLLHHSSPTLVMEYQIGEKGKESNYTKAVEFTCKFGYRAFLIVKNGELQPCENLEENLWQTNSTSENIVLQKT